jgi:hypothetical protein
MPGDWLLIASDGIPEASGANGEEFGETGLLALLAKSVSLSNRVLPLGGRRSFPVYRRTGRGRYDFGCSPSVCRMAGVRCLNTTPKLRQRLGLYTSAARRYLHCRLRPHYAGARRTAVRTFVCSVRQDRHMPAKRRYPKVASRNPGERTRPTKRESGNGSPCRMTQTAYLRRDGTMKRPGGPYLQRSAGAKGIMGASVILKRARCPL